MCLSRFVSIVVSASICSAVATNVLGDDATVWIEGGTFWMGTDRSDIADLKSLYEVERPGVFVNETPAHEVTLSAFRIDKYEVTNERFAAFLRSVPEWRKDRVEVESHNGDYLADWTEDRYPDGKAQHPVVFVTWSAAQSFCRWQNGRLPTEAEWEFVARSGDSREFPWGDELPSPAVANYYASEIGGPVAVGSYPPNELGVYDLAGNVWEFLLDTWAPEYPSEAQADPIAGGHLQDEQIPDIEGRRAVRGASFGGSIVNLRTRWRDSHVVSNATEFVGFRCAYSVNQ